MHVEIKVLPVAEVEFPDGFDFTLHVPPGHCFAASGHGGHGDDGRGQDHGSWFNPVHGGHGRARHGARTGTGWSNAWSRGHFSEDNYCRRWFSDWFWPVVRPARISFSVVGNALAVVSVTPSSFLRVWSRKYLGKAVGPTGDFLGYQAVVHFPAPSSHYAWLRGWESYEDWDNWRGWGGFGYLPSWSRWAKLPGVNGHGTPPLTADVVRRGGRAFGVIYLVARSDWTADGRNAHPGDYAGALELTISAENR